MNSQKPFLGVLCWEGGSNPKGLEQLESLPGNSTNPLTYSFPVLFKRVKGANYQSVLVSPDTALIGPMVEAAETMIEQGVKSIITSCGFNAIFQQELAAVLKVPVFTSALMQIPFIRISLGGRKILVITASKKDLKQEHFQAIGVADMRGIEIYGMDEMPEWSKISRSPDQPLSIEKVEKEIVSLAVTAKEDHPDAGAILLECTDLPPFANAVRKAVGLQVYDLSTMVSLIHDSFST
ncbi:aspartate/glutamate racemase family protein [Desulfosediminicola ganghwensis]|uniref:aspartate/glutamate racemase family protein n=1 Tax=Desulfosediminicola ganghwensis TaxID=2569540 RepID=UPI0010AC2A55|nr:aspartate/glutamate racemase family protein [Desulfosediminicola ganghwensis]